MFADVVASWPAGDVPFTPAEYAASFDEYQASNRPAAPADRGLPGVPLPVSEVSVVTTVRTESPPAVIPPETSSDVVLIATSSRGPPPVTAIAIFLAPVVFGRVMYAVSWSVRERSKSPVVIVAPGIEGALPRVTVPSTAT